MFYIWSDHKTHQVKQRVIDFLEDKWYEYRAYGSKNGWDTCDITEFIPLVCEKVRGDDEAYWIMICGTWIGVDIWANRFAWIRSVFAHDRETAERWKKYDNSNVLCLSWWKLDKGAVYAILKTWIRTEFEDEGWRRSRRLDIMDEWK